MFSRVALNAGRRARARWCSTTSTSGGSAASGGYKGKYAQDVPLPEKGLLRPRAIRWSEIVLVTVFSSASAVYIWNDSLKHYAAKAADKPAPGSAVPQTEVVVAASKASE